MNLKTLMARMLNFPFFHGTPVQESGIHMEEEVTTKFEVWSCQNSRTVRETYVKNF